MADPHSAGGSIPKPFDAEKYAEMTESYLKTHFQPDSSLLTKIQIKDGEFGVLNATMLKQTLQSLIDRVDDHQINSEEIPIRLQIQLCRFKSLICQSNRARALRWEEMGFELGDSALDRFDREELLMCALRVEHRLLMQLYTCDDPTRRQGVVDNLQRYRQQIRNSGQPWGRCPTIVEARRDLKPKGTASNGPGDRDAAAEGEFVTPPTATPVLCQGRTHRRYYRPPKQCRHCEGERRADWASRNARVDQISERLRQSSRITRALDHMS